MKKLSILFVLFLSLSACTKEESNLKISGTVKGLKKGTLFLQKIDDTALVTLDSLVVQGSPEFVFETNIESPQVLYLYLEKKDGTQYNDRLLFFAEPGEMTITTTLKDFESDARISGSENHKKLEEYQKMMARFNAQELELLKTTFKAQHEGDAELATATNQKSESLLKRRYLYTVNFAVNNKEYEVAPYLAISEIFDVNFKYLDTIHKSMTPEIRESKYGRSLEELLEERRKQEDSTSELAAGEQAVE